MALVYKRLIGCALGLLMVVIWPATVLAQSADATRNNEHAFDFEFGTWKTHVSMLKQPLAGSKTWAEYDGITVVHKVWNGEANVLELDMQNTSSHLKLASFRLYNPVTRQWGLYVANSRSGTLGVPCVGRFADGRGVFYDKETFDGKSITVRFVITPRSVDAIHFEQAFSADDGKTWETNWIADDTRVKDSPT